jgi:death-on-curing protein
VSRWKWVVEDVALAIHDEQLAEHGGASGLRDLGLLQSTLARPQHLAAYGKADASALAAAYMYGLVRNHPFVDGNKRTGLVLAELFLALNGYELEAMDTECVSVTLGVADGSMTEAGLVAWLRGKVAKA